MFFVPVLFWLSSVLQDFLSTSFRCAFDIWFTKTQRKQNRCLWSYTCLFGRGKCHSQVAVWLTFKMFKNFCACLSVRVVFLFSFSFSVFPVQKGRCWTAQETEATQDDSLSGASGGLAVSKIETIIDSPEKCVWTGWIHLHFTKVCIYSVEFIIEI